MKHNAELTSLAQRLRKNMTKEERRLWYEYLNCYPCRFRRQVTCGNYILDFYCSAAKLAVELDGGQHFSPEGLGRDQERTDFLDAKGIMVLRFANNDVMRNLSGVCEVIDRTVQARMAAPAFDRGSQAFPSGEGGMPKA